MGDAPVIKSTALYYNYSKDVEALVDVNLQVERGSVYGFLGPNGSGKTTALSLLLGLLQVQQGSIELFGEELQANRIGILKKIGCLIESPSLYGHLSAKENLEVYRAVYGASRERIGEVLKTVGLADTGNKELKRFSLGMKQRLAVALALLPSPELLVLDEPTNGLDPNGMIEVRELVKKLNMEEGITVLVSSHILSEVEETASHIGIILKGRMLFQGTLQELHLFQQKRSKIQIATSDNEAAIAVLQDYEPEKLQETLSVTLNDNKQAACINRLLLENGLDVYLLQPERHDLEQLFVVVL
ncbi:ABC transporter ATP-binding protein [Pontibacter pamirensis]|uniref:ABC transporter ATP-binding protein n=1 Tax=Pontibacter pamirensis TaxID=2562824 RepID=UPI0013896974|nr:ATP-binding cassette domain-containing protein [Pontibacter pamirensis]